MHGTCCNLSVCQRPVRYLGVRPAKKISAPTLRSDVRKKRCHEHGMPSAYCFKKNVSRRPGGGNYIRPNSVLGVQPSKAEKLAAVLRHLTSPASQSTSTRCQTAPNSNPYTVNRQPVNVAEGSHRFIINRCQWLGSCCEELANSQADMKRRRSIA